MYDNLYESYTPYEAGMFLKENKAEFNRIYRNMRSTLQRRAKVLERKGREYTAGYQKIKAALASESYDRAKNFSLISTTVNTKYTKYSYQIAQERDFRDKLKKMGVKVKQNEVSDYFRYLGAIRDTKMGEAWYESLKMAGRLDDYFSSAVKFFRDSETMKDRMADLLEYINGLNLDPDAIEKEYRKARRSTKR